ncbi:MAG TPA: hypothetical protein VFS20_26245 [Longimicrobium sp.]|nr:hypothetical protein [Longimicrobium sp.]
MGPVTSRGDTVVVTVVSISPLPGVQQDIIISPLQLSRIPAPRGPVLWIERAREQ